MYHYELFYKPLYKPNQVILGTGRTAITSGWTEIKTVANRFKKLNLRSLVSYTAQPGESEFLQET
jgi:hypothetical protein